MGPLLSPKARRLLSLSARRSKVWITGARDSIADATVDMCRVTRRETRVSKPGLRRNR